MLDDLQWADDSSLETVAALLRRAPRGRLLLALAFRPAPVRPLLATALATAERDGRVIEHPLRTLSFADAETLLGHGDPRRRCAARSTRRAAATRSSCSSSRASTPPAAASPPSRARRACRARSHARWSRRSRRCADAGRLLAQGAAVAGDPVDLDLAIAAADLGEADALPGAGRAARRRPARADRRRRAAIASATRSCADAIYGSAAGGWRIAAHGRAAAALETRGGSLAARAHHLERCARPGDAEAVSVLVEAGRHAAARAPATAADRFARGVATAAGDARDAAEPARAARRPRPGAGGDRAAGGGAGVARRRAWGWSARSSRRSERGSWRAARCARTCSAVTPPPTRAC